MNVDTHHNQIIDLESGKRLDAPEEKVLHGKVQLTH
jgi:hypothetical protein